MTGLIGEEVDVVVVGSGAGGLMAALSAAHHGRSVLVLERSDRLGGATAMWGGMVWAPNHHLPVDGGFEDSVSDALTYCRATTQHNALVSAFVYTIPEIVRWVEEVTPISWQVMDYPDSFAEEPTGRHRGRHLEVAPLSERELGEWRDRIREPEWPTELTNEEIFSYGLHLDPRHLPEELLDKRVSGDLRCGGRGLVSGLLQGCLMAGVNFRGRARAVALDNDGTRVCGVELSNGKRIAARHGVVLASGGFEWDENLTGELVNAPLTHRVTPPLYEGDAVRMSGAAGARLAYLSELWAWAAVPGAGGGDDISLCMAERFAPHSIWINRWGRRFVNESAHNSGLAFAAVDTSSGGWANLPAWVVVDSRYRSRYRFGGVLPGEPDPPHAVRAESLPELAGLIGVDFRDLLDTVERFNADVADGLDTEWGRGQNIYERFLGDQRAPSPSLGAISRPPFWALPLIPSAVGTKGGPVTNTDGQVLNHDDVPIPGLYAAGNAAARIFGPASPAFGAIISSAFVLGYRAGRHVAAL